MRSLFVMLILVIFASGNAAADNDNNDVDVIYRLQVGTLITLGILYHTRRDTPFSDSLNKMLRILLYGMATLAFLIGGFSSLFGGNTWIWWMVYSALIALTGTKMGHIPLIINKKESKSHTALGSRPPDRMFELKKEMTAIECPGCKAQMDVPKLGKMQNVTCKKCGLSGEIDI